MSDRLDRIEAGLDETRKIVESNAKAILALTERSAELDEKMERMNAELNAKIDRTNSIVTELANIVYAVANRQQDHENRINRLEQE
jgi:uncharacterized protein YoxC